MKNYLFLFVLLSVALGVKAQKFRKSVLYNFIMQKKQNAVAFKSVQFFSQKDNSIAINSLSTGTVANGINLTLNKAATIAAYQSKASAIILSIPSGGIKPYILDLAEQDINTTGDFSFGTINKLSNRAKLTTDQGLHYRGCVEGDSSSIACISIFDNGEVIGIFSNNDGNFNIGRSDTSGTNYIIYNSKDLQLPQDFTCATTEEMPAGTEGISSILPVTDSMPKLLCKKVRFYWEAAYSLYSYNFHSDIIATRNYLLGLFNQVSTMFLNEGIMTELSETYVWTSTDPYRSDSAVHALTDFKTRWNALGNNFNGDLAHLIAGGTTNNGGIAYLISGLCNRNSTYAYSNVYGIYKNVPVYSWDVNVVTHETGHNLGSHHTHWCGWNTGTGGTCGAIDNCYKEEPAGICISCPVLTDTATRPIGWQGTIMSYCHLTPKIGINLANGFGPLPQAVIRNSVSTSSCLTGVESWTGTESSAWENSSNWSCGVLPTATTDVIITQGVSNYPVINSAATCHKLTVPAGTSVQINTLHSLNITGIGTTNIP